jgi:hypothetical protein
MRRFPNEGMITLILWGERLYSSPDREVKNRSGGVEDCGLNPKTQKNIKHEEAQDVKPIRRDLRSAPGSLVLEERPDGLED